MVSHRIVSKEWYLMETEAILTSSANFTSFSFGGRITSFRTSPRLERYTKVLQWDKGYLVVMAKYQGCDEVEEYIDLEYIYDSLGLDAEKNFSAN